MELCFQNIKEISIVSSFVFQVYDDYWYKDLLRISEKWISYKRTNFTTNKVTNEWSYQTNNKTYIENWDSLKKCIIKEFESQHDLIQRTDCGELNIRVTLINNDHLDLKMSGGLEENGLGDLSFLIKRLIPVEEIVYPDFLDIIPLFLQKISMTRESLKDLNKQDICALMYAEGGAMGSAGETCIIDIYGNEYVDKGLYDETCDITQIEIIETFFDGFKHIDGFASPAFNICRINDSNWIYINLGYGNHLYLRHDFWHEHGLRIMATDAPERYGKWKRLIKSEF